MDMDKQATKFGVYGKAPPADFLGQMAYPVPAGEGRGLKS